MRIAELVLSGYKGIDACLHWNRVNVLFGPNDAGKTNILEAVASVFGGFDLARSPTSGIPRMEALIELDSEADDDLLAELLIKPDAAPTFPALSDRPRTSRLRWCGREGARTFDIGSVSPKLPVAVEALHKRALRSMRGSLGEPETWGDVETLLRGALGSRWLRFSGDRVVWLCPSLDECEAMGLTLSAQRLAKAGFTSDAVLGPLVTQIVDRSPSQKPFIEMTAKRAFRPFRIIWGSPTLEGSDALEAQLREAFDSWYAQTRELLEDLRTIVAEQEKRDERDPELVQGIHALKRLTQNTAPEDRWVRNFPWDPVGVSRWALWRAEDVARRANDNAAPLVRQAGDLRLEIRLIRHWAGGSGRRMNPTLKQPHREEPTPIAELGAGLSLWSSVALLEAANAKGFAPPFEELGSADERLLLIVDEPERHLHPRAQVELAQWLAAGTRQRDLLIATHSVPFLNMPPAGVALALVTRDADGVTRATDITDDAFGRLDEFAAEAGLSSPAEALHLLRGVILVEGAHDERVLQHFYGNELARDRILIFPVRGANNVNAIVDAPWLSRYGAPLVILFDEVDARKATGPRRPSGRHIAVRAIWDLLSNWDQPVRKPDVVSFPLPDIFRALPEACIARAAKRVGGAFPGWEAMDRAFERDRSTGFKKVLLRESGLASSDIDDLLDSVLSTCRQRPSPVLSSAIADARRCLRQASSED